MPTIKHRLVGTVTYSVLARTSNGTIPLNMDDIWEKANIIRVHVPQLAGVDDGTSAGCSGIIRFHRQGASQLVRAFAEVERLGLKSKILTFAGSYYPRMIRGSSKSPSEHSFGTALDLNAAWNGLGRTPAAPGSKGDLHAVAAVFKRHGFVWGGDWKNRADGMHLEIGQWMEAPAVAPQKPVLASVPAVRPLYLDIGEKSVEVGDADLKGGHYSAEVKEMLTVLGYDYGPSSKTTPTEYHLKVWKK